ncbi:hypothetical protein BDN72DRAFT_90025 [Pluteus cervinus]|uniref:Uncharacterized protein n=1 Tax=Pluteus cervinus TaxID=181527 RepID=A0ACD3AQR5_9AGAR|nr:hypothetical protein BDN72DRAFT_90025 [Pluteus cervinus]
MPPGRKESSIAQKAQEKESKRARGVLSCAECRRLKLKCDKTVPCSSCKRRGCSEICPNGSLVTGQGTRFVLADTDKLHQKISYMSDRIRQLEDALVVLQAAVSSEPHPLLDRELLKIKSSLDLHAAVDGEEEFTVPEEHDDSQLLDTFGTLAIRDDGAATFYGRSAGQESLLIVQGESSSSVQPSVVERESEWTSEIPIPQDVSMLADSFPFPPDRSGIDMDYMVQGFLPSWSEAWRLCELYLEQAPWFFGAVARRQLHEEVLPIWYDEAPRPSGPSSVNSSKKGAHELALLFAIFCFGALTDVALPPAPGNVEAERYYQLTKAALGIEPVLERPPSVSTVQALSLMAIYEGLAGGENSIEGTWALMGLATKLAQSVGLHRDCARWGLPPAEVQKRRALFWELFITDCWQGLATGRCATFSLPFVDCELPSDPDQIISDDGAIQPSFPFWKAKFGAECVSAVVQGTLTSRAPKYSIILELDRKVRDMILPSYAQGSPPQGVGLAQTMSHFMPINYRELTLLYIHRCFFTHALETHPLDPIKSQYAPSFLAGYRSACTIIGSVKQQFAMFPDQIARFWVLWTHTFSATIMLAHVVTRSPQSRVAPAALLELGGALELFQKAAAYGGRAVKFFPIVQRLQAKARQTYVDSNTSLTPPANPTDIFRPSNTDGEKDEFSIFGGQTHTLTTKSSSTALRSRSSNHSENSSRAPTDSPQPQYAKNFAGAHPTLVNELYRFHGQVNTRALNQDPEELHQRQMQHPYVQPLPAQAPLHSISQVMEVDQGLEHLPVIHKPERMQLDYRHQEQQRIHQQRPHPRLALRRRTSQQFQDHSQTSSPISPFSGDHFPSQLSSQTLGYQHHSLLAGQRNNSVPDFSRSTPLSHSQSHPNLQRHFQPKGHPQHPQQQPTAQQQYNNADVPMQHSNWPSFASQFQPTQNSAPPASHVGTGNDQHHQQQRERKPYVQPTNMFQMTLQSQPQAYTPGGVLAGIAADDRSLQETWQSYMSKVGTPRMHFED